MPTFDRTVEPAMVSVPRYPAPLISFGQSGKAQLRSTGQRGRIWQEQWPPLDTDDPATQKLLAMINNYYANGTIFDIVHRLHQTPKGVGSGTPLVAGGSQTGSTLNVDGVGSVTNWLRAGDVIKVAGINTVFEVTADVNSSGGNAAIPINPPILAGGSPADNAAVTVSGVLWRCIISEAPDYPLIPPHAYLMGLTVQFREVP